MTSLFKDCDEDHVEEIFRCSPESPVSCIDHSLQCDGEINCAFGDHFGNDELNCTMDDFDTMQRVDIESGKGGNDNALLSENYNTQHGAVKGQRNHSDRKYTTVNHMEEDDNMKQYFFPTAFILFIIWGIITMIGKMYRCYKYDIKKEEPHYYT